MHLNKKYPIAFAGIIAAVILDQLTKYLAVLHLKNQNSFVLIRGVFELHYLENRGAAFGMMQDMRLFFIAGALIISAAVLLLYGRMPDTKRYVYMRICAVLLCAGAIGNLIDRIVHGYVIDFFYFKLIDFPIFNVADCYVVVACILFVILILFYYKDDEFDFIHRKTVDRKGLQ